MAKGRVFGKPKCVSLVLCDLCIEDTSTHNKTLVGLFNRITAANFPAVHPRMSVVFTLSGGHGEIPIEVVIRNLTEDQVVLTGEGTASFGNPLGELDVAIELRNVPIASTGTYVVEVLAGGEPIGSRRFSVETGEVKS